MTLHLLERDREGAAALAAALHTALDRVGRCRECRNFTELAVCELCSDPRRDPRLLCIVETPGDVFALEASGSYRGRYYVLLGHLSPIDGIGPGELGLDQLAERFQDGDVDEVILATNPTVEGEATAFYIADRARSAGVAVTRIAQGVPLGGELEYTDATTLAHALAGRTRVGEP